MGRLHGKAGATSLSRREFAVSERVAIRNYRLFTQFDVELHPGLNIVVGDNDTGKSTLIEAINLVLTGRLNGRPLAQELNPYLLNLTITEDYVAALQSG